MSAGYVYIFSSAKHPYLRIGSTNRVPEERVEELLATTMDEGLEILDSILVDNCELIEAALRRALAEFSVPGEQDLFNVSRDASISYLRRFSKRATAENRINQERKEIEEPLGNISVPVISELSSTLQHMYQELLNSYQREVPDTVAMAAPILYESFRSSPRLHAERSDTVVAVSLDDEDADPLTIGVGEYRFTFEQRQANPQLLKEFRDEGNRVVALFGELERLKTSIARLATEVASNSALDSYEKRAKFIVMSARSFGILNSSDEGRLLAYALHGKHDGVGAKESSSSVLTQKEEFLRAQERKIDSARAQLLGPILSSLREIYDIAKQAQDIFLLFIEGIESLFTLTRRVLFSVSRSKPAA